MIGIDEVGRGCWAGPLLVVAARQVGDLPAGLADSKLLSPLRRRSLMSAITDSCELGEGWVEPAEIDQLGLTAAMRIGVQRALKAIKAQPDEAILMDGKINYCSVKYRQVTCEAKADQKYAIVSAASIHAKVTRDAKMSQLAKHYPGYGFEKHVGYGTAAHRLALDRLGPSELHRLSFQPLKGATSANL